MAGTGRGWGLRPRLLDACCGAGGAAAGYVAAGFDVTGVDHAEQPRYLESGASRFILGDALEYIARHGCEYAAIHASPPCQAYSMAVRNVGRTHLFPALVPAFREALERTGRLWVIENVQGAPLRRPVTLCGSMFGLGASGMWLRRHRLFESNFPIVAPACRHPVGVLSIGVYGNGAPTWHRERLGRNVLADEWREAMGCPWMVKTELSQAIPPAYARLIGDQLRAYLED